MTRQVTKITITCDYCSKEIKRWPSQIKETHNFCCRRCAGKYQWRVARIQLPTPETTINCDYCNKQFKRKTKLIGKLNFCFREHWIKYRQHAKEYYSAYRGNKVKSCYMKEARAILTGKHWEGKNKCTKLEGDELK